MNDDDVKAFNDAKARRTWFGCGACGAQFPSKENRDAHRAERHGWYGCDVCGAQLPSKESRDAHRREMHGY